MIIRENTAVPITVQILLIFIIIVHGTLGIAQEEPQEINKSEWRKRHHQVTKVNETPTFEGKQDYEEIKDDIADVFENINEELQQFSLYTEFIRNAKNQSSLCYKELELIRNDYLARKPWAIKVLDATGVRPPGFLLGHNLWLGSRDTCHAAQYGIHLKISDHLERFMKYGILTETAPFDVNFKVAYLDFKSEWQIDWKFLAPEKTIIWGICLPASCSNTIIADLMEIYIKSDSFIERRILGIDAIVTDVKDLGLNVDFFNLMSVKVLIGILGYTFVMIVAAICLRLMSNVPEQEGSDVKSIKNSTKFEEHKWHLALAFVKCYDVKHNLRTIFHINESENGGINEICAIRSINANLIIIMHVLYFAFYACVNRTAVVSQFGRFAVGSAFVIVEPFFALSGFLLAYNFLRNQKQRQLVENGRFNQIVAMFLNKIFHRWLRLAPLYYFIVCLNSVLHALLYRVSVFNLPLREDLLTADSWWRYLLFIQNFLKVDKFPTLWTWSVASEMQFFLIGTALLFIYTKRPILGVLVFFTTFLCSIIVHFYNGIHCNLTWEYDVALRRLPEMYLKPLVRIISHLMGMLSAWYVVEKPGFLNTKFECAIGNLSLIILGVILSPLCDSLTTTPVMATLTLLVLRLMISVWICWLVIAAVTKRRTWLSPILEHTIFQPTSRVSYGIYLLNPIIITTIVSLTNTGVSFDWTILAIWVAGTIMLTKWAAVIFSVAFEMPYCNLSALLLKQEMMKKLA